MRRFTNRAEAGRELAPSLQAFAHRSDVTVIGLPRGGVPVAFQVAEALEAPLDVLVVRKLGLPDNELHAIGAIAAGGVTTIDWHTADALRISDRALDDYLYSPAAKRANLVWGEAALRACVADP